MALVCKVASGFMDQCYLETNVEMFGLNVQHRIW